MAQSNRVSIALIGIGVTLMAAALVLFLFATGVIGDGFEGKSDIETITAFGEPIKTATPGPSPTPSAKFPPGVDSKIARLKIPSVEIDAPVVTRGVDLDGIMQSPDNAYDTAWYDFSARPGFGGNAVFAGHVDWASVGEAVFWDLKDLAAGDLIEVQLEDGTVYTYSVSSLRQYDAKSAPIEAIVGATPEESVTLITCSGTFSSATHQYDQRLVIRAVRVA